MSDNGYSNFEHQTNRKRRRKRRKERLGFYVAFAICLLTVGMAVFSTYTGITNYLTGDIPDTGDSGMPVTEPVNNIVTGVADDNAEDKSATKPILVVSDTMPPTAGVTEPSPTDPTDDALQTMLTVSENLSPPLDSFVVSKPYSANAVYNKTLNDWRAHPALDLKANTGDKVYSMCDGTVEDVSEDDFLGNLVIVKSDNCLIYYCGLGKNSLPQKGSEVKKGDVIGDVGTVPFEAMDDSHIHIEIKVGDKYTDPLTVINNEE